MSENQVVLEFSGVSFSYNETANVKNLNVKINKGDFTAIIGSNGAGKSTFSKLCNGLLKPSSGDVLVCGKNTKKEKVSTNNRIFVPESRQADLLFYRKR